MKEDEKQQVRDRLSRRGAPLHCSRFHFAVHALSAKTAKFGKHGEGRPALLLGIADLKSQMSRTCEQALDLDRIQLGVGHAVPERFQFDQDPNAKLGRAEGSGRAAYNGFGECPEGMC